MSEQSVPNIIVDFEVTPDLVFVVVQNIADQAAFKLRIKPSTAIKGLGGKKNISSLSLFREITYMAPKKEIRVFVDSYDSFFEQQEKLLIRFSVSYENEEGRSFGKTIEHNLAIYKDLIFFIQKK